MQNLVLRLLICLCLVIGINGIKETFSKTSSDMFSSIVINSFGMAVGGKILIDYEESSLNPATSTKSYLIILILTYDQLEGWYGDLDKTDLSDSAISTMCQQPSMLRRRVSGSDNIEFDITPAIGEDRFTVAVLQCYAGDVANPVSIDVTVTALNARPDSLEYSHTAIERVMEIRVLEGEMIIYALMIAGLLGQIFTASQASQYTRYIHWLFLVTLVAVLLSVTVKYGAGYRYNKYGTQSTSMTVAENVSNTFATALLLSSLLMLSFGWTLIRAGLSLREQQLIAGSIGAFLIFSLAGDTCLDSSPTCNALNLIGFILQILILAGVVMTMNFSVTQLRVMVNNSPWVPSTPLQYARLKQYNIFRLVFVVYVIASYILEALVLPWRLTWVGFTLSELLDVAVIFHVGVTFSPLNEVLMIRSFGGSNSTGPRVAAAE